MDELLHHYGLDGIVDQAVTWLCRAASGQLLDLAQGWEPVRRDSVSAWIEYDADSLASRLPNNGTVVRLPVRCAASVSSQYAWVREGVPGLVGLFTKSAKYPEWYVGDGVLLAARAAFRGGAPVVHQDYCPDDVRKLEDLYARAKAWGIDVGALTQELERCLTDEARSATRGGDKARRPWAAIVLAVHRPAPLIGANGRQIELVAYLLQLHSAVGPNDRVYPAGHRESLSARLLARVSGHPDADASLRITQFGCGSLGSKLAMHLGRSGFGNFTFVDNAGFYPHNIARHALHPEDAERGICRKAEIMKAAFAALGYSEARARVADGTRILMGRTEDFSDAVPLDTKLIVDATAAGAMLAAETISPHLERSTARLCRIQMYARGRVTAVMLEGELRSARVDDLLASLFARCLTDSALRGQIASAAEGVESVLVGENCRSATMPMSDSVVSRGTAMAAAQVERWLCEGIPRAAHLCFARTDANGIGAEWNRIEIGRTRIVSAEGEAGWQVRVTADLAERIEVEAKSHSPNETGGVLLGMCSEETKTIVVASSLSPPADSIRLPTKFVIGTQGLIESLSAAARDSLGYLHFVGTWHSHPLGGPFSWTDLSTLAMLAATRRGLPAISLVWTPSGLMASVARLC